VTVRLKVSWPFDSKKISTPVCDAIEADEQQRVPDALKLYGTALEVISEALALPVTSSGLSAKCDNVANWRQQLRSWQQGIQDRLEGGGVGDRGGGPWRRVSSLCCCVK